MKSCTLLVLTLFLFSCSNEDVNPNNRVIHMVGILVPSHGSGVASYWKDTIYTALADENFRSGITSLSVDGSSVVVAGYKTESFNVPSVDVIWRNGIETVMEERRPGLQVVSANDNLIGTWLEPTGYIFNKDGISYPIQDTAAYYAPVAMFVEGNNVYHCGFAENPHESIEYPTRTHAQYWKNGQLMFREEDVSFSGSIFVSGSDVYMAGLLYPRHGSTSIACYWKNGERVDISDGTSLALPSSIFVSGSDVYVAGQLNNQAVYWKNGELIFLTSSGRGSVANSIVVQGGNVHIGGAQHGHPAYWKNGVREKIANDDKNGEVRFIGLGSN